MKKISSEIIEQIENELNKGNKLAAIKLYHEATDSGLLEAKKAIETWHERVSDIVNEEIKAETFDNQQSLHEIEATIFMYLENGQKLQAVKWVKELMGWGLKEAKDFVDKVVEKHQKQAFNAQFNQVKFDTPQDNMLSPQAIEERIYVFLAQKQKIEAIKWVKELKGWSLKESMEYVEALAQKHEKAISAAPISGETQEVPSEKAAEHEGKIAFQLSPLTYPKNAEKSSFSLQNKIAILLVLTLLAYLSYKIRLF